MNCNPDYMFSHAEIAGKLTTGKYKTYDEYVKDCKCSGITYYNEDCYKDFMAKNFPNH